MSNRERLIYLLEKQAWLNKRDKAFRQEKTEIEATISELKPKTSPTAIRTLEKQKKDLQEVTEELASVQDNLRLLHKLKYEEDMYIDEQAPLLVEKFLKYLLDNVEQLALGVRWEFVISPALFILDSKYHISGQIGFFLKEEDKIYRKAKALSENFYLGRFWFPDKGFKTKVVNDTAYVSIPLWKNLISARVKAYFVYEQKMIARIQDELEKRFDFPDFSLTIEQNTVTIELLWW